MTFWINEIFEYAPSTIYHLLQIFQRLNYDKLISEGFTEINHFKESIEMLISNGDNKLDKVLIHNLKWICTAIENNVTQISSF